MLKRIVTICLAITGMMSLVLVAGPSPANADEGIGCWIPQPSAVGSTTPSRQRLDGTWEALTVGDEHTIRGLCVELLPGMWVYKADVPSVAEYLAQLNGKVKLHGEWVDFSPMIPAWDLIGECEAGGRWHVQSNDGKYGGLFQIAGLDPATDPQEQLNLAYSIYDRQGWGAWRNCAIQQGLLAA